jgi:RNA-directed DNA polymerase
MVAAAIGQRMEQVGLRLHPGKTRVVYCKDASRPGSHEHVSFDFLAFTFRARAMRSRHGTVFTEFGPAASKAAMARPDSCHLMGAAVTAGR